ncbi:hypothetical protein MAPG_11727 [Magnaporthiopsis poae ATCC 64411]|uniref:Uncharacterized protein n=1 Tax=Magnaporthiopsis poae (strain ATCC 64411 / 73-15) TaxID=644358 RepID=A0A0C4EG13_MAGP6|nr:hypothetical protein MAPG_11727 [Magnaporthiopsis poae ATCC 64411]
MQTVVSSKSDPKTAVEAASVPLVLPDKTDEVGANTAVGKRSQIRFHQWSAGPESCLRGSCAVARTTWTTKMA